MTWIPDPDDLRSLLSNANAEQSPPPESPASDPDSVYNPDGMLKDEIIRELIEQPDLLRDLRDQMAPASDLYERTRSSGTYWHLGEDLRRRMFKTSGRWWQLNQIAELEERIVVDLPSAALAGTVTVVVKVGDDSQSSSPEDHFNYRLAHIMADILCDQGYDAEAIGSWESHQTVNYRGQESTAVHGTSYHRIWAIQVSLK
ncbi:hypothetical protein AB0I81_34935 [Nonomuraea sp. NPDC050404]|uniref:hypothetical protein n=1 Tax=Nonomuraea sp. NPDC050404 TaxID=3155783 RepID=UPI0033F89681